MSKLDHKKEMAQILYVKNGLTQKQIAELTEISVPTINRWASKYQWKKFKATHIMGKVNTLQNLYEQMIELQNDIKTRPEGKRYPNSKEADTIVKITSSIEKLESGTPVNTVVEVFTESGDWLHKNIGYKGYREWILLGNKYVEHLINKQGFDLD